jgi:putative ABC transport system permease protein
VLLDGVRQTRSAPQVETIAVSDSYFATLGVNLVSGQGFQRSDTLSGSPGVILTESLAHQLGEPRDIIGHHVKIGTLPDWQHLKIVGVVSNMDISLVDARNTKPFLAFVNFWQHQSAQGYPVLLLKTKSSTVDTTSLRTIVEKQGYEFIERFGNLEDEIDNALVENFFVAYLSSIFGLLALMLAAAGLFGLLNYQLTNRLPELGLRLALGAQQRQIRWLVVSQTIRLISAGISLGLLLTFALERLIGGFLFDVTVYDPRVLLLGITSLSLAAFFATWVPASRASKIDPMRALRLN